MSVIVNRERGDVLFLVAEPLDTGRPFYVRFTHEGEVHPFFRWWVILLFVVAGYMCVIGSGFLLTFIGARTA